MSDGSDPRRDVAPPTDGNPVVARLWRGGHVESIHRGAWVVVDTAGNVIDGRGDPEQPIFARSSTKSIQLLPLLESGAAATLGVTDDEIAVSIASHNGEPIHVDAARSLLARARLSDDHLRCGPQRPAGAGDDSPATRITNNCSGKHAAFLAGALHLGDDPADYIAPSSSVQRLVHRAVLDMTGADESTMSTAIDGCSAPTFLLALSALATGLARMANPDDLAPARAEACRRIVGAARDHPELVEGTSATSFDTAVLRATDGRLFAKRGAEGVQTVGIVGSGVGFAAKIDDGSPRSIHPLTLVVLGRMGHIDARELDVLQHWTDPVRRNLDGLDIGRHELCPHILPGR